MATLYPARLEALFQTFDKRFEGAYNATETYYEKIATVVPSSSSEVRYAWMDKLPFVREWLGERIVQSAIAQEYTVRNKTFELTVGLEKERIEDDQLEVFTGVPESIGMECKLWADKVLAQLVETGETSNGFDSLPFFSASHLTDTADSGSATQSNLLTGSALTAITANTGRAALRNFKGRDGLPLGVGSRGKLTLMVPPALEATAFQIANAEFIAPAGAFGGNAAGVQQTNALRGTMDVLVNPYLTSATAWYLLDVSMPIKPLVWQLREAPAFQWLNRPDDENVFWRKEFIYGASMRGNAGFGLWFLALKGKP